MRKHVCFLIPDLNDGGAQIQCLRLLEALQDRDDIEPSLIYLHDGVNSHRLESAHYRVRRLQVRSNYDPRNIPRIQSAIRDLQPDILFTWLHACDVYGFFLSMLNPHLPWLMAERGSSYPRELRYRMREMLGRHADAIVANSAAGRRYWEGLGAKGALHIVSNIVALSPSSTAGARSRRIAMVGRLEPQKNPLVTIAAFCALAAQRPDLEFVVIGEGSLRSKIEAMILEAGMTDRIALLGFRDDAHDLIGSARLLVTLSHHEGTPNVLLEAVTAGTRAVVSDIPEHREVLGEDYPLFVADRSDPAACTAKIIAALTSGDQPGDYGYARDRLAQMSPEAVAERYVAIFQSLRRKAADSPE